MKKAKQLIVTSNFEDIQHIKLNNILAFRVKNGVYKVLLKGKAND